MCISGCVFPLVYLCIYIYTSNYYIVIINVTTYGITLVIHVSIFIYILLSKPITIMNVQTICEELGLNTTHCAILKNAFYSCIH